MIFAARPTEGSGGKGKGRAEVQGPFGRPHLCNPWAVITLRKEMRRTRRMPKEVLLSDSTLADLDDGQIDTLLMTLRKQVLEAPACSSAMCGASAQEPGR